MYAEGGVAITPQYPSYGTRITINRFDRVEYTRTGLNSSSVRTRFDRVETVGTAGNIHVTAVVNQTAAKTPLQGGA